MKVRQIQENEIFSVKFKELKEQREHATPRSLNIVEPTVEMK